MFYKIQIYSLYILLGIAILLGLLVTLKVEFKADGSIILGALISIATTLLTIGFPALIAYLLRKKEKKELLYAELASLNIQLRQAMRNYCESHIFCSYQEFTWNNFEKGRLPSTSYDEAKRFAKKIPEDIDKFNQVFAKVFKNLAEIRIYFPIDKEFESRIEKVENIPMLPVVTKNNFRGRRTPQEIDAVEAAEMKQLVERLNENVKVPIDSLLKQMKEKL